MKNFRAGLLAVTWSLVIIDGIMTYLVLSRDVGHEVNPIVLCGIERFGLAPMMIGSRILASLFLLWIWRLKFPIISASMLVSLCLFYSWVVYRGIDVLCHIPHGG